MRRFGWVVVLIALFLAWQAWVDLRNVPNYLLPSPTDVLSTLWDERSSLFTDALHTFGEMIAGFALAIVTGLGTATRASPLGDASARALSRPDGDRRVCRWWRSRRCWWSTWDSASRRSS